ncbi:MAG: alanine--tRNA ligase [Candidatus Levyibacteriota bacterium]
MHAADVLNRYIVFFTKRGHKQIPNASLVPDNDPTTLFTSSGMQPLVPYLLGEQHPQGTKLVDVQNCFRAQDIDEIGDNRHTTFFRMLGNWSLGDYFKDEQLPWFFTFLTDKNEGLGLNPAKLYVTVFEGNEDVGKDEEAIAIWTKLFEGVGLNPKERIFTYGVEKNWWSRSGVPKNMPPGEPGGPDSEVFYDFETPHDKAFGEKCHVNCDCGRFLEIGNSVFMQYQKQQDGSFKELPKRNVDFGGGLERLLAAHDNEPDMFMTSLFFPIIKSIEKETDKEYQKEKRFMRIVTDHFVAGSFIVATGVRPSNTEQGYILRRLIRRGLDAFYQLSGKNIIPILEQVIEQYRETDPVIEEKFESIKDTLLTEEQAYQETQKRAKKYIEKKYKSQQVGDELMGQKEISPDDAFILYSTHGLSPTQIENLGFVFDRKAFAAKMEEHQKLSRTAGAQKFAGGLADHQEKTIMGHTATHLLQQALRDVLGDHVFQTGSNITTERLRFDFSHPEKLTDEQLQHVEKIVNEKILENMPVHFEMLPLQDAKKLGAIGLFDEKYQEKVKVYFMGGTGKDGDHTAYSKEFCGGPHVDFTGKVKSFKIIKQENIGHGQRRIYAVVG